MICHKTYSEYEFEQTLPTELERLINDHDHLISEADPLPDSEGAWNLEKPASWIELLYPAEKQEEVGEIPDAYSSEEYPEAEEIGIFLYEFSHWFYFTFNGLRLFFSRFPSVPPFLAHAGNKNGDAALSGILLGYDLRDVAQYTIECGQGFKMKGGFEN